jgi:alkyl hydroperoxide reductase subunit F
MAKNIIVYGRDNCPYCEMATAYFDKLGEKYEYKNVAVDPAAMAELEGKIGAVMGVPVIDIDGSYITGFDKRAIKKALAE